MTAREVINKLSLELAFHTGNLDDMAFYKQYLQMALVVGAEHFVNTKEEIVAMDHEGREVGRYKSIPEAATKLGLHRALVQAVVNKRRYQTGGLLFIRAKEGELIKRKDIEPSHLSYLKKNNV